MVDDVDNTNRKIYLRRLMMYTRGRVAGIWSRDGEMLSFARVSLSCIRYYYSDEVMVILI